MEFALASAIGVLTAAGVYLLLRARSFDVILGLTLLSYATNLLIFSAGRLVVGKPPVLREGLAATLANHTDPLPQALVLTAIVIAFAMTAVSSWWRCAAMPTTAATMSTPARAAATATGRPGVIAHLPRCRCCCRCWPAPCCCWSSAAASLRSAGRWSAAACSRSRTLLLRGRPGRGPCLVYLLGDWPARLGIALVVDRLAR
jgi:multicomponent K+:H+ antiporter subunit C